MEFYAFFNESYSKEFDVQTDLDKIGVVNQTTMLASETQEISDLLKNTMIKKFGEENIKKHFADTRDTLCYATNDNQSATTELLKENADLAIVIGGYNSSNTSHLVELLQQKFPTYFISDVDKISDALSINHFDLQTKEEITTINFLPAKDKVTIALTSGASCPDSIVDEVINKILSYFEDAKSFDEVISDFC